MGSQNQTLVVVVCPVELRSCSPRLSPSLSCPWPLPRSKLLAVPSGKLTRTLSWPTSLPALDPPPPRGDVRDRSRLRGLQSGKLTRTQSSPSSLHLLVPLLPTSPRPNSTLLVRLLVLLQSTTPKRSSTTSRRLSTSLPVEPAESE